MAASAPGQFTTGDLAVVLLISTVVLLVAIAAVRLANRSGLPTLLLYLGIGLVMGESGLGLRFDNPELTQVLGYSALVLILAEGGLTTRWSGIRSAVAPASLLSTVGVLVSVAVVGLAAHLLLHKSLVVAMLLGAIVSSTDAAAVFSVLRRVPLPKRITGVLEAESGFNDAPVVLLVVALADAATPGRSPGPWWLIALEAVGELAGGALIGLALGWIFAWVLRHAAPSSSGLFSIGVLAVTVLAYAAASLAHTSGFIATYLCALLLGNLNLPHHQAVRGFSQALGWLAQIGLFVLLGLLASPARLDSQIIPAIVIGLVLLLVARPASVLLTLPWFRFTWREQAFLSWAGLRGAVPVVLATVPLTVGTPHTEWIFDLVFVLVVVFTLVQALPMPLIARRLGVVEPAHLLDLDVEATPLEELNADVLQVSVGDTSRLHGVEVQELRLPAGADVTLVVRDGEGFVPRRTTVIRRGDRLLLVTTATARSDAIRRVRSVSRDGRMAGWRTPLRSESE
ncbi:potassium/proton antiporter [Rudaeicoccus suwonensis]|uniref:Potassium/proton antiporter (CPA1 family) n=1 Tax=Rudaeicoccus suwonensis TaxID=657409 RepID=A0A561E7Z9_9MICO|nr:potassium/proton antiporter [Rudaeicoccus suwonensis]TWE11745.1 potassium/proton antiporter (CPA1 family) [Rudaeicoccus suwonensis]